MKQQTVSTQLTRLRVIPKYYVTCVTRQSSLWRIDLPTSHTATEFWSSEMEKLSKTAIRRSCWKNRSDFLPRSGRLPARALIRLLEQNLPSHCYSKNRVQICLVMLKMYFKKHCSKQASYICGFKVTWIQWNIKLIEWGSVLWASLVFKPVCIPTVLNIYY